MNAMMQVLSHKSDKIPVYRYFVAYFHTIFLRIPFSRPATTGKTGASGWPESYTAPASPMPRKKPAAIDAADTGAPLPAVSGRPLLQFEGVVEGSIMQFYQGLYVPEALGGVVPVRGKLRVIAEFNGERYERALIPDGGGRHFLILGGDMRRALGLRLGSPVTVRVWPDPRADDRVEPCEELAAALALEPRAAEQYAHIKPGQRRGLNYYISQGKRPETRVKRAVEIAHKIATGTLYSQQKKDGGGDEVQATAAADGGSF